MKDLYGYPGNESILCVTLDLDNGVHRSDIIDVNVAEKRKYNPKLQFLLQLFFLLLLLCSHSCTSFYSC